MGIACSTMIRSNINIRRPLKIINICGIFDMQLQPDAIIVVDASTRKSLFIQKSVIIKSVI